MKTGIIIEISSQESRKLESLISLAAQHPANWSEYKH